MNNVNEMTIYRDNYKTQEEFEAAVKTAVMLLLNEDYILTIKYDDKGLGVIVIHYDYADMGFGGNYPHWLSPEEFEQLDLSARYCGGDFDSESL